MKKIIQFLILPILVLVYSKDLWAQDPQKPAPTFRDYVYDWAYGRGGDKLDLDQSSSLALADFISSQDQAHYEKLKFIFQTEFNAGARSLDAFNKVIQQLKQEASQATDWLEAAYARAKIKQKRLEQFKKHFQWAYETTKLNLSHPASTLIANFLTDLKEETLIASVIELIAAETRLKDGGTDHAVQSLISKLSKEIDGNPNPQALIAEFRRRAKTAKDLLTYQTWAYARGNQSPDFEAKGSLAVAEFMVQQSDDLIPALKNIFLLHAQMSGTADPGVLQLIGDLMAAAKKPGGLQTFIKKYEAIQAHFMWAIQYMAYTQTKIFPKDLARPLAFFLAEAPPQNVEILKKIIPNLFLSRGQGSFASIQAELTPLINNVEALRAAFGRSEEELKKAQHRGRIYYWAYNSGGTNLDLEQKEAILLTDFLANQDEVLLPLYFEIFNLTSGKNNQSLALRSLKQLQQIVDELKSLNSREDLEKYKNFLAARKNLTLWLGSTGLSQFSQGQTLPLADALLKMPEEIAKPIKEILLQRLKEQKSEILLGLIRALISNDPQRIQTFTNYPRWTAGANGFAVCEMHNVIDSNIQFTTSIDACLAHLPYEYKKNKQGLCLQIAPDVAPIKNVDAIYCENPIALDIQNAIHTFDRPLHLYHYVDASRLKIDPRENLDIQDQRIKNHHIEWTQYFWSTERQNQSTNSGLYTAIDPAIARADYGRNRPILYRVEVAVGYRYLHYNEIKADMSQPTREFLKSRKCPLNDLSYLFKRDAALSVDCLRILYEVVRDMNLVAMSYNWGAADIPNCNGRDKRAFIIYNANILTSDRIRIYHSEEVPKATADLQEAQNIQRLMREIGAYPIWYQPKYSVENASDQEHMVWKKRHLFNCQQ